MIMTYDKYKDTMEKLKECVYSYDNLNFSNNVFTLMLANGDMIRIRILKNNISHLLGINCEAVKLAYNYKKDTSAYEVLQNLINEYESSEKLHIDSNVTSNYDIFSKYIDAKLEIFLKNINMRSDDMVGVIKYDSEKTYQVEPLADKTDYFIIRKNGNCYYVLGIVQDINKSNLYLPSTSRKYDTKEEFMAFMKKIAKKQEITYPYFFTVQNVNQGYMNKFPLRLEHKSKMLTQIITLANQCDSVASVSKDYLYSLNKSTMDKTVTATRMSVLRLLSDSIQQENVLDRETITELCGDIELNDDIDNLISSYNDFICSKRTSDGQIPISYSKISSENVELKQQLEELREQITVIQQQNYQLQEDNLQLQKENEIYHQQVDIITDAYQKIKQIGTK